MKNNKNKIKDLVLWLLVLSLVSILLYLGYTIEQLQSQVNKRDALIYEQTERENENSKDYNDLINSLNTLFSDAEISSEGKFDVSKFIENHIALKDSINQLKTSLDLIKKNYGITTTVRKKSDSENNIITTTSIKGSEKIDSALLLLPYFRDRLTIDKDYNWSIKLTGKEYENVRKDYEDNVSKYNSLVGKYNKSVNDYSALAKRYNENQKFYQDMLIKMSKKGLVKIDSTGNEVTYTY